MKKKRTKSVELRINGIIPGIKTTDLVDGILETRDNALIAKLRDLPNEQAEQVFKERVT